MRNLLIICAAVVILANGIAQANVTNGGFETGDFTGWSAIGQTSGLTSIETAAYGNFPTEGTYQALISNYSIPYVTDPPTPLPVETFLGLSHPLNDLVKIHFTQNVINAGAIKQDITANVGDVLTFDWNFLCGEGTPASDYANDFAFVAIDGTAFLLADTYFPTFTPVPLGPYGQFGPKEETGFNTYSYTFTTSGIHTIGVGVANVVDYHYTSEVLVDNFGVHPIPAPSAVLLGSVGVTLVTWLRKRRAL